jgi:hypothetical protein
LFLFMFAKKQKLFFIFCVMLLNVFSFHDEKAFHHPQAQMIPAHQLMVLKAKNITLTSFKINRLRFVKIFLFSSLYYLFIKSSSCSFIHKKNYYIDVDACFLIEFCYEILSPIKYSIFPPNWIQQQRSIY